MKKNEEPKKDLIMREKLIIGFMSAIELLFLLMELYLIVNLSNGYGAVIMIGVAIGMMACLMFLVMAIVDLNQKTKDRELEEFEEIYKAQKASYLSSRRFFEEMDMRMQALESNSQFPTDDIISAQKAVAKLTINRNKESAEELLNANDALVQRFLDFEQKMETKFLTLESIEAQMAKLQEDVQNIEIAPVVAAPAAPVAQAAPAVEEEVLYYNHDLAQGVSDVVGDGESLKEFENDINSEMPSEIDSIFGENVVDFSLTDEDDSELDMTPSFDMSAVESEEEPEIPAIEPEEPVIPAISTENADPNKQLSADEIAALFASAAGAAPEPEPEPEPEKPPMPDLSDPNKTLSPDEIAALFANM